MLALIVEHRTAALVDVRAEQTCGTPYEDAVIALRAGAAESGRAEEVIIAATLIYIRALGECASELLLLGAGHDVQTVVGELDDIDAAEGAPHEIVLAIVIDILSVDRVAHAYRLACEQGSRVDERALRTVGPGYADAALVTVAPHTYGVVEHILVADMSNVGRPDHRALGRAVAVGILDIRAHRARAGSIGEGCTDEEPVDKVPGAVDGHIVMVLCAVEVEVAVVGLDDTRVRHRRSDDGVCKDQALDSRVAP